MAPGVGFEPTTNWLTANCATAALPGNNKFYFKKQKCLSNILCDYFNKYEEYVK